MFESMKAYTIWLLNNLPTFLMSEPICYFVAILLLLWIVKIIYRIANSSY